VSLVFFLLMLWVLVEGHLVCGRGGAAGARTEAELIAFCRDRLAHFKCPDAIEFGPLPKTSTGKVQKFVLRDREWGDRASRIN
jgi:acyl-CoA synthetase (AMP-forming)/AMP-acid ligase II